LELFSKGARVKRSAGTQREPRQLTFSADRETVSLARSMVGTRVRFRNSRPGGATWLVARSHGGKVELERLAGKFDPWIFVAVRTPALDSIPLPGATAPAVTP
jgi:hypothetical protein